MMAKVQQQQARQNKKEAMPKRTGSSAFI